MKEDNKSWIEDFLFTDEEKKKLYAINVSKAKGRGNYNGEDEEEKH